MPRYVLSRLRSRSGVERVFRERFSEPLHLNVISGLVAIFGGVRSKTYFDLYVRPQFAFGVLHAADIAKRAGVSEIKVLEFGVATGTGLLNLSAIARRVTEATGIAIEVIGFDGGAGLPEPRDYRDHPDLYTTGTFHMIDSDALVRRLPSNARLILGEFERTVPEFLSECSSASPIGFASVDVDYYFSAVDTLKIFDGRADWYLPVTTVYFDDIWFEQHNPWCGERLAIREFNERHDLRKIAPFTELRGKRLFKNARWIDQTFTVHVLDHPARQARQSPAPVGT
jgi:hypothetical protein